MTKLKEDSVPRTTGKEYVISQEFILYGSHEYSVKAETMGEAIALIENDPDLFPTHTEQHDLIIAGYTEAGDNYDS